MAKGDGAGAPPKNRNGAHPRMWRDALRRCLARNSGQIDRIAKALCCAAENGDIGAIKELGDRLDGRAVAEIEVKADVALKESFVEAVKNVRAGSKKES